MSKPNIILIMTDQQRYDTIQALGYSHMITPNLDRLVREGVAFTQTYCTAPSCAPSRASFFNGRYMHAQGVFHNKSEWGHSWVEMLQEAGYHTVNIGKMHTTPYDAPCGFDQRFVVENKDRPMEFTHPHGPFYDEWDKFLVNSGVRKPSRHHYKEEHPDYETSLGSFEWPLEEKYHPDVFVGNMARSFIEQRQSESPLFLQIGFPGPHPPYDPPKRFVDLYEGVSLPIPEVTEREKAKQPYPQAALRREMIDNNHDAVKWHEQPTPEQLLRMRRYYAANVTLIDEKIGEIMDALERRGYLDNAIVLFTSDHGDCTGDHGHIQKWTMYDAVMRVPMVVWAPKRLPTGERSDALLQHMDMAATLLDMAGLALPADRHAQSVLADIHQGREYVFAEHPDDCLLKEVHYVTMVRNREYKLVHYLDQDCGELYDLRLDPEEVDNRWGDGAYADIQNELLGAIRDWRIRSTLRQIVKDPGFYK